MMVTSIYNLCNRHTPIYINNWFFCSTDAVKLTMIATVIFSGPSETFVMYIAHRSRTI